MIPMAIRKISLVLIRSWTDCESSSNATKGKVLLDECIDSRLADHIHAVGGPYRRRSRMGGITNGKLLAMAQAEFDGFVPVDRNLSFQEHLTRDVRRDRAAKKNQACAPFPERERSIATEIPTDRQGSAKAAAACFHKPPSKSTTRKQKGSSFQRGGG